ncbi:beta-glucosidase 12-like [Morus notabilis]|uniref:beta-glucosidase 12-like n=1 Tax=Morus notabilis TaxID=981085 RepID=UPI000CED35C5|nr:beta-glucosidase 12-like [Morus notabilis]
MGTYGDEIFLLLLLSLAYLLFSRAEGYLSRESFPPNFIFGTSSSAYQYEGAGNGRGPHIWDTFTATHPEKILDHTTGAIGAGFYYHYKEDIDLLKEIGFDSFRFSISWTRILPRGKISGGVNKEGVQFYNNLIDELLSKGLTLLVTLFHWDSPQVLEDEYGGFLSLNIVNDYRDYVNFCFEEFGDRVKNWITFNEPNIFSSYGYDLGLHAPGRCSKYAGNCTAGNSAIEPYVVVHHILLAHATAVKLYREKYQVPQNGKIGINMECEWYVPKFNTSDSYKAASRALDFLLGWTLDPIIHGDYPRTMRSLVKSRLPKFTEDESKLLKGSLDFIGLSYYTAFYAEESTTMSSGTNLSYTSDSHVVLTAEKDGVPIGQLTPIKWLNVYPKGLKDLVLYIKRKYNDPPIYITENGVGIYSGATLEDALNDSSRISCYRDHLSYLLKAIKAGANVKGYYAWSLLDNFEWESGYAIRFGMTYVDFKNKLQRHMKDSAFWFKKFLKKDATVFIE